MATEGNSEIDGIVPICSFFRFRHPVRCGCCRGGLGRRSGVPPEIVVFDRGFPVNVPCKVGETSSSLLNLEHRPSSWLVFYPPRLLVIAESTAENIDDGILHRLLENLIRSERSG